MKVMWTCLRCGIDRVIDARIEKEYGDFGSVIGGEPVYELEPPCSGYFEDEAAFAMRESTDESPGWCPFDGKDDYGTGDEDAVWAIIRNVNAAREADTS